MKTVHFVGGGGIGVSALAQFFLAQNCRVSASDQNDGENLQNLKSRGAKIFVGHSPKNLPQNCELLIYSSAIEPQNCERARAAKLQIPQKSYFEILAQISKNFFSIAVAGTHGKSTTTAMAAHFLNFASNFEIQKNKNRRRNLKFQNEKINCHPELSTCHPELDSGSGNKWEIPDQVRNDKKGVQNDKVGNSREKNLQKNFGENSNAENSHRKFQNEKNEMNRGFQPAASIAKPPLVFCGTKIFNLGNSNFFGEKIDDQFFDEIFAQFLNSNLKPRKKSSRILIFEACEHFENFLKFTPSVAILTNVEADHLDFFKTEKNYFAAFEKFILKSENLIADFSEKKIQKISQNFRGKKIDSKNFLKKIPPLKVFGAHNRENASKVAALAQLLKIDDEIAKKCLQNFRGTYRRLEFIGEKNGVQIFDDYAHHPTEIRATLAALRGEFPRKKIWCVFQPHQFLRTKFFFDEFAKSFFDADEILIPNIFAARENEKDFPEISAEKLAFAISENSKKPARCSQNFAQTLEILKRETRAEDLILTAGAGDVFKIARDFAKIFPNEKK